MRRGLKSQNHRVRKPQNRERGYMLISLMLMVALITIGLLMVLPSLRQQVQRDREIELQHRGTAYMRAIQHFYRKFNRYPTRVEELEQTNNLRFLRKRYKDPVNRDPATGKEREFKLLHQQDINLNNGPIPGLNPAGSPNPGPGPNPSPGPNGGLGGGLLNSGGNSGGGLVQKAGGGSGSGGSENASEDDEKADSGGASGNSGTGSGSNSNSDSGSGSSSGLGGQVFGGGPILGVASASKAKGVHVFFDKSHYNDWLFIYVSQGDRGGLLVGPINPGMPTAGLGGPGGGPGGGALPGGPLLPGGGVPTGGQGGVGTPQPPINVGQSPPDQ